MSRSGRIPATPSRRGFVGWFFGWLEEKIFAVEVIDGLRILHNSGEEGCRALNKVREALALIRVHDPARYRQVIRDLRRVWIMASPAYSACYHPNTSTCELNEGFVLNNATTAERIASSIVHEATHAHLHGSGIGYAEKDRVRIEGICIRREMAFARKLPEGMENWQQAETKLDNLPDLSDKAVGERNLAGLRAALLYLDAPKWLASLIVSYQRWRYRRRSGRQKIN